MQYHALQFSTQVVRRTYDNCQRHLAQMSHTSLESSAQLITIHNSNSRHVAFEKGTLFMSVIKHDVQLVC